MTANPDTEVLLFISCFKTKQKTRMTHFLDFVFVFCLFLSVESQTGRILPPSNLSFDWIEEFNFSLSWTPPPHSMEGCTYEAGLNKFYDSVTEPVLSYEQPKGRVLEFSVQTRCEKGESDAVEHTVHLPDLVKDFQCNVVSSNLTRCSWLKVTNVSDLRFFYRLTKHQSSMHDKQPIKECSSYKDSGGIEAGCDLQANDDYVVKIFIKGTLDRKPSRNVFDIRLSEHVKLPALDWNVTETKDEFIISWVPPEIFFPWEIVLNYTECKTHKSKKLNTGNETTSRLPKVSHCQYWMSIKAKYSDIETPWSKRKYFEAEENTMVYAAVIIPLVFAGLALFAFVFCRKNKENIFPKIPEPKNLLGEIHNNNNNKGTVYNLYTPEEEEDNCTITLVKDSQTDKL